MKIIYTKAVTKDVKKIKDKKLIGKIVILINTMKDISKIEQLKSLKKMSGHPSAYRIRIGSFRLGFYCEDQTIILARFLKRNDIPIIIESNLGF